MVILALLFGTSEAAEISSSPLNQNSDVALITISGQIKSGDADKFRQLALAHKKAVVLLNSDGGSTIEAIEIGKLIKIVGYSTYVSSFAPCNSACSLIWLAGSARLIGTNAKVGFHATYLETDGKKLESGVGNAIVGSYLNALNLGDVAIVFATSAPPDEIQFLTKDNLDEAGITAQLFDDTTNEKNDNNNSKTSATYKIVGNWTIGIDQSLRNGCFALGRYNDDLDVRFGFDARSTLSLYLILVRGVWKSIKPGDQYELSFQLDSDIPWSGKFYGIDMGDSKGVYITIQTEKFLEDLSKSHGFQISYGGKEIDNGELTNIAEVVVTLRECQSKQSVPADPFAK